jgi:iron complex outermembrane recepter protein
MYRKFRAFNASKRAHSLPCLIVTTSLWPLAVQAQQTGKVMELPTVEVAAEGTGTGEGGQPKGSLTVPPVAEQRKQLYETVGSVDFVDANTPEIQTRHVGNVADALKDVPGVFAQDRFGTEIRLSIRGCGLTRFFHLRCIELL